MEVPEPSLDYRECRIVRSESYKPLLYVRPEAFWSFDSNISARSCVAPDYIADPPGVFEPASTSAVIAPLFASTGLAEGQDQYVSSRRASAGYSPTRHTPSRTNSFASRTATPREPVMEATESYPANQYKLPRSRSTRTKSGPSFPPTNPNHSGGYFCTAGRPR